MKKLTGLLLTLFFIIFIAGCFTIPIGDGNKMKISKDGVVFTDDKGDQHKITVDKDDKQFKMEGFNTDGDDAEVTIGENLDIPDSLPNDIPIADNANVYQITHIQNSITLAYSTSDAIDQVIDLYEKYFNSHPFDDNSTVVEELGEQYMLKMFEGNRGDTLLKVTVEGTNNSDEETIVSIYYQNEENED